MIRSKNNFGIRTASLALVAALGTSFIPYGSANAAGFEKTKDNTCMRTSGIAKPVQPDSADDAWEGSYVYYGKRCDNPLKYRVLTPKTTEYGGTSMFLDCDVTVFA